MKERDREPIKRTGPKELAWFIGLWALGVAAILIIGAIIKLFI